MVFDPVSFFSVLDLFPKYFFPKVLYCFFGWCIFTLVFFCLRRLWNYLQPVLNILFWWYWFCLFLYLNNCYIVAHTFCLSCSITWSEFSFFSVLYFLSNLFLFIFCAFISYPVIYAKADNSFLTPFILSCVRLIHGDVLDSECLICSILFIIFLL